MQDIEPVPFVQAIAKSERRKLRQDRRGELRKVSPAATAVVLYALLAVCEREVKKDTEPDVWNARTLFRVYTGKGDRAESANNRPLQWVSSNPQKSESPRMHHETSVLPKNGLAGGVYSCVFLREMRHACCATRHGAALGQAGTRAWPRFDRVADGSVAPVLYCTARNRCPTRSDRQREYVCARTGRRGVNECRETNGTVCMQPRGAQQGM
jgi:hypothetical protein